MIEKEIIPNTNIFIGERVAICANDGPFAIGKVIGGTKNNIIVEHSYLNSSNNKFDYYLDSKSNVYINKTYLNRNHWFFLYFFGDMPYHFS